jgi:hypothetical protein
MTAPRIERAKASIYEGSKHQRLSICGKSIPQNRARTRHRCVFRVRARLDQTEIAVSTAQRFAETETTRIRHFWSPPSGVAPTDSARRRAAQYRRVPIRLFLCVSAAKAG